MAGARTRLGAVPGGAEWVLDSAHMPRLGRRTADAGRQEYILRVDQAHCDSPAVVRRRGVVVRRVHVRRVRRLHHLARAGRGEHRQVLVEPLGCAGRVDYQ